jgi:hypothetical protein
MADPHAFDPRENRYFAQAERLGFPAFLTSIAESSPANASPYLCLYEEFRAAASRWSGREPLLAALDRVRSQAETCGVVVEAMLIGGSFVALSNPSPRDVDCLMFYRQAAGDRPVEARRLGELRRQAKGNRVDVRFVPVDGGVLPLIKSVCYFSVLFSMEKQMPQQPRTRDLPGLLLLDCQA